MNKTVKLTLPLMGFALLFTITVLGSRIVWFKQQIGRHSQSIQQIEKTLDTINEQTYRIVACIAKIQAPKRLRKCLASSMQAPSSRQIVRVDPNAVKLAKSEESSHILSVAAIGPRNIHLRLND